MVHVSDQEWVAQHHQADLGYAVVSPTKAGVEVFIVARCFVYLLAMVDWLSMQVQFLRLPIRMEVELP